MDLQEKVAVVTGASAGLGRAFAVALAAEGVRVFGLARSKDRLTTLAEALGDRFTPVVGDVTDEASVERAFDAVEKAAGRLDVLVNNAGLGRFEPADAVTTDALDAQLDTNVRGLVLCTRRAIPVMRSQYKKEGFGGHVVNVASVAGIVGNAGLSAYNATKFAVRGLSEAWMKELRADRIKVTCLYPGSIQTGFSGDPKPTAMRPEDIAATLVHVLRAPDGYLISEVVMRPLIPGA